MSARTRWRRCTRSPTSAVRARRRAGLLLDPDRRRLGGSATDGRSLRRLTQLASEARRGLGLAHGAIGPSGSCLALAHGGLPVALVETRPALVPGAAELLDAVRRRGMRPLVVSHEADHLGQLGDVELVEPGPRRRKPSCVAARGERGRREVAGVTSTCTRRRTAAWGCAARGIQLPGRPTCWPMKTLPTPSSWSRRLTPLAGEPPERDDRRRGGRRRPLVGIRRAMCPEERAAGLHGRERGGRGRGPRRASWRTHPGPSPAAARPRPDAVARVGARRHARAARDFGGRPHRNPSCTPAPSRARCRAVADPFRDRSPASS